MWRYVVPAVGMLGAFLTVIALDDRMREPPPVQFDRRPAPLPPLTLPQITPPAEPVAPAPEPAPPPAVAVAPLPQPPLSVQPAPQPTVTVTPPPVEKPKPRPKPAVVPPVSRPVRPPPDEPPSLAEDVALAHRWMSSGNYREARQMLGRIQTRMVFQPVSPDQPDRNDLNAAATMVGIAIRAIDAGDMRRAARTLNDICQMERCQSQSEPLRWSQTEQQLRPNPQVRTEVPQSWPATTPQQNWSGYEPR